MYKEVTSHTLKLRAQIVKFPEFEDTKEGYDKFIDFFREEALQEDIFEPMLPDELFDRYKRSKRVLFICNFFVLNFFEGKRDNEYENFVYREVMNKEEILELNLNPPYSKSNDKFKIS